jgi:hypothetical protein
MNPTAAGERTSRALDATSDLTELLRLAHGAIHRAQREAHGEAYHVASRLSRHMHYMRKVTELLRHEIERFEDVPAQTQALPAGGQQPRLPLRARALSLTAGR